MDLARTNNNDSPGRPRAFGRRGGKRAERRFDRDMHGDGYPTDRPGSPKRKKCNVNGQRVLKGNGFSRRTISAETRTKDPSFGKSKKRKKEEEAKRIDQVDVLLYIPTLVKSAVTCQNFNCVSCVHVISISFIDFERRRAKCTAGSQPMRELVSLPLSPSLFALQAIPRGTSSSSPLISCPLTNSESSPDPSNTPSCKTTQCPTWRTRYPPVQRGASGGSSLSARKEG